MTTPAELRAAAAEMRTYWGGPASEPIAAWLDFEAELIERVPGAELRGRTERALAVARTINTGGQP